VELEFHQLDVRYERLRVRQPARERRLLASLADAGQQMPIVVVTAGAAYVVVDGHKRVRCLRRLHRDTVAAVIWEMPEPEALIFRQLLHTDATDSALEQGWLLRTLHQDHGLTLDALARRFAPLLDEIAEILTAGIFEQLRARVRAKQPHRALPREGVKRRRSAGLIFRSYRLENLQHRRIALVLDAVDIAGRRAGEQPRRREAPQLQITPQRSLTRNCAHGCLLFHQESIPASRKGDNPAAP
jgi:hypothetical protein